MATLPHGRSAACNARKFDSDLHYLRDASQHLISGSFSVPYSPRVMCAHDACRVICRDNVHRFRLSTRGRRDSVGIAYPLTRALVAGHSVSLRHHAVHWPTGTNFFVPVRAVARDAACNRNCISHGIKARLGRDMASAKQRAKHRPHSVNAQNPAAWA